MDTTPSGTPSNLTALARLTRASMARPGMNRMNVSCLSLSRRSITIARRFGRHGVAGDRRPCRAEQARARCGQGDPAEQSSDAVAPAVQDRAGDRQRPLPRCQRAAGAADQRRPRADRRVAPQRLRCRRGGRRQQGRHGPRGRPAEDQDQAGLGGDAVLRRLRRPGRPRELHDPGRCRDLEGIRRAPRRRSASKPCWRR